MWKKTLAVNAQMSLARIEDVGVVFLYVGFSRQNSNNQGFISSLSWRHLGHALDNALRPTVITTTSMLFFLASAVTIHLDKLRCVSRVAGVTIKGMYVHASILPLRLEKTRLGNYYTMVILVVIRVRIQLLLMPICQEKGLVVGAKAWNHFTLVVKQPILLIMLV